MVISTQKPSEIKVISVKDDIKAGTCTVKYAFRINIQETTQTIEEVNPETGETTTKEVQAWQYEEIIDEMTIPLYLKPALESVLKTAYEQAKPHFEELINLSQTEVPSEIKMEG